MQLEPVNLVALVGTILGISIVLIPVIGVTARFALNPVVDALSKLFDVKNSDETLRILERRLELQEQEISVLNQAVQSLTEAHDFERQLAAPSKVEGADSDQRGPHDSPAGA